MEARFDEPAQSQTLAYSRVGIMPIGAPHREAYAGAVSRRIGIEGIIVIGSRFEKRAISAPGARSGAGLQSSVGTPLADRERETIVAALDRFHGNTRRRAEVLEVSVETLRSRLSAYNHRSESVSLSVV